MDKLGQIKYIVNIQSICFLLAFLNVAKNIHIASMAHTCVANTLLLLDWLAYSFPELGTPKVPPAELLAAPWSYRGSRVTQELWPLLNALLKDHPSRPHGPYCTAGWGNIWRRQLESPRSRTPLPARGSAWPHAHPSQAPSTECSREWHSH